MTVTPSRDRASQIINRILIGCVAFGIVCRVTQYLWRISYWHDEAYLVLNIVGASARDAFGALKLFQAAPPGFLLAQIWISSLFGDSEYVLRALPLLLSCIAVGLMAIFSRRVVTPIAACMATAMFAVSDRLIWHASECKQYSGDVFVVLVLLLLATGDRGMRRFFAIAAVAAVTMWFSHTTVFVFGGISIITLIFDRERGSRRWLFSFFAANALFGVSLAAVYFSAARYQQYPELWDYWGEDFVPWSHPLSIPGWFLKKSETLFNYPYPNGGVVLLVLAIMGLYWWRRAGDRRTLALLLVPLALNFIAAAAHRFPFSGTRVTLYSAPGLLLIASMGVDRAMEWAIKYHPWPRSRWLLPIAVVMIGVTLASYRLFVPRNRGHVRPSAEYIAAHRSPDERVYVVGVLQPWQCYLKSPTFDVRTADNVKRREFDSQSYWLAYSPRNSRDEKDGDEVVAKLSARTTVLERFAVEGSAVLHLAKADARATSTTSTAGEDDKR